jgi:hypothetical protein
VVRAIAASAGFTGTFALIEDTDDVIEGLHLQQNEPIFVFLTRMARKFGYRFKVEKETFHFHSPHWSGANFDVVERFVYGAGPDILNLDIDADFRLPLPTRVTAKSYDFAKRVINVADFDFSQGVKRLNAATVYGGLTEDPARKQLLTRAESGLTVGSFGTANKRAQARFIERHWNAFQINLKVTGNPKLLAGRLLELAGTGSPLVDGRWYISEARHTVDADTYVTQVKLKHPPKNKVKGVRTVTNVQDPNFDRGTKTMRSVTIYHKGRLVRGIRTRR